MAESKSAAFSPKLLRSSGTPNLKIPLRRCAAYAAVRQQPLTPQAKLGWLDSNQRMAESKSAALPLGDTPSLRFSFPDGTANGNPDYRPSFDGTCPERSRRAQDDKQGRLMR